MSLTGTALTDFNACIAATAGMTPGPSEQIAATLVVLAATDDDYVNSIDAQLQARGMNLQWVGSGPNDGGAAYNRYRVVVHEL